MEEFSARRAAAASVAGVTYTNGLWVEAALLAAACKCLCVPPLAGLDPGAGARIIWTMYVCVVHVRPPLCRVCLLSETLSDTFGNGRSSFSSRRRGDASLASARLPIRDAPNCMWAVFIAKPAAAAAAAAAAASSLHPASLQNINHCSPQPTAGPVLGPCSLKH